MAATQPVNHRARLSLPSDTEILIVRDFHAPRELVFDAWSNPAWVRHWYGCHDQTLTVCEIEFREGGAWRWVLRSSDGTDHGFSGSYREIARPDRLVFTQVYEPYPGSDHVVSLTFEQRRSALTTMSMLYQHSSKQNRDGHLQSGMEVGLEDMLHRLDEMAQREAAARGTGPRETAAR